MPLILQWAESHEKSHYFASDIQFSYLIGFYLCRQDGQKRAYQVFLVSLLFIRFAVPRCRMAHVSLSILGRRVAPAFSGS
jgi:hypothetical protein